ncbi:MAG: potassium channel family protein [Syntrophobacteraceae bacterium]
MNVSVSIALAGAFLIVLVLWEAFETIIFPRRVTRRVRLTRIFYRVTWRAWRRIVYLISSKHLRENLLSIYGPLSLIVLLSLWACTLIVGFGLLHWGSAAISEDRRSFITNLYYSGTTFFTLGLGDVRPLTAFARLLTVAEAGTGLGFLAIVIGYLPGLNNSFSRREVNISLLDARAGSPPTAAEILHRHNDEHGMESIRQLLHEWERWSAELLESHLSYPVLAFFRSQHDNQSWLAALTSILDASALVMVGLEGACVRQAQLTFAMARHAVVDLSLIFGVTPRWPEPDRLPPAQLTNLRSRLIASGLRPKAGDEADRKLMELRTMYEPFIFALSTHFRLPLPPWVPESAAADNWQAGVSTPERGWIRAILPRRRGEGHF